MQEVASSRSSVSVIGLQPSVIPSLLVIDYTSSMDSKFNILIPALGIITALLWRLILNSENQNSTVENNIQTKGQKSTVSGQICADCGLDRFPVSRRKCPQCGSVNFTVSPHYKICGYCQTPNGKYRDTRVSCHDSI